MSMRPSGVGAGVATGATLVFAALVAYAAVQGWWSYLVLAGATLALGAVVSAFLWSGYRDRVKEWEQEQRRVKRLQDLWGQR